MNLEMLDYLNKCVEKGEKLQDQIELLETAKQRLEKEQTIIISVGGYHFTRGLDINETKEILINHVEKRLAKLEKEFDELSIKIC